MKWYKTRIANYIIFGLLYFLFLKITNDFELVAIIALGQIIGEMKYNDNK